MHIDLSNDAMRKAVGAVSSTVRWISAAQRIIDPVAPAVRAVTAAHRAVAPFASTVSRVSAIVDAAQTGKASPQ